LNDKISEKDKKDWENFLANDEKIENKEINLKKINRHKVRTIDLHGYTLDEANKKIETYIIESHQAEVN